MKNIYLLKDLAQISGHSVFTIKHYLRCGLLQEIGRSPVTNFRFFDDLTLARVKQIRQMRLRKISLNEIKKVLDQEPGLAPERSA